MSDRSKIPRRVVVRGPHRMALMCVAAATVGMFGCSDQPVAPSAATPSAPTASADRFDLNSAGVTLEWEIIRLGLPKDGRPTGEAMLQALAQ